MTSAKQEKVNLTPFPHNHAWDLTGSFHFVFYFIYTKVVENNVHTIYTMAFTLILLILLINIMAHITSFTL